MRALAIAVCLLLPTLGLGDELGLGDRLRDAIDRGQFVATDHGFRMLALSFIADGCAAQGAKDADRRGAAHRCIAAAHRQASRLRAQHADRAQDGLWLSHANLILGAAHRVGPCLDDATHRALSEELARRSLAEPTAHVASFAKRSFRWPADQAATLASLRRYDHAHGTRLAAEPIQRWREWIFAHAFDARLGLPHSEATGRAKHAATPRGCALTFETIYLREVDDALARAWWQKTKEHYLAQRVLVIGFREWPVGIDGGSDADSGPIVAGIGAAATAFGLVAARVMDDVSLAEQLAATEGLGAAATRVSPQLAQAAQTTLADAIRFLARHTP